MIESLPGSLGPLELLAADLPVVVLVHGGGGTAFKEWAKLWAKRGYAAIAMDLAGCGPQRKRLAKGGPGQSDEEKFGAVDQPFFSIFSASSPNSYDPGVSYTNMDVLRGGTGGTTG